MAKKVNPNLTNITEYPNSFKRQKAFPLERYSVFETYAAAENYARTNGVAYVGQTLAIPNTESNVCDFYIIKNEDGDLEKLVSETQYDSLVGSETDAITKKTIWGLFNRDNYIDRQVADAIKRITGMSYEELPSLYEDSNTKLRKSINDLKFDTIEIDGGGAIDADPMGNW